VRAIAQFFVLVSVLFTGPWKLENRMTIHVYLKLNLSLSRTQNGGNEKALCEKSKPLLGSLDLESRGTMLLTTIVVRRHDAAELISSPAIFLSNIIFISKQKSVVVILPKFFMDNTGTRTPRSRSRRHLRAETPVRH
jgi:hypothetical protein